MYLPPQFKAKDRAHAVRLITEHPFASLISNDEDGLPFVTHLPLHLVADGETEDMLLLGHVAKPNPHWRYLQARPKAVVTFLGPHAYLSPQVYPDLARVPTWNYLAVHCTVEARLIEDPAAKDALLKQLIGDHEPAYAKQWRDLGEAFAHKMLAGIVGFELRVTQLECKLKLNQHRPEAHEKMLAMYAAGTPDEQALAAWMAQLGMVPAAGRH
ncbi:transcriptional regulator [Rhodoferax koreense]|uniref:Transcriptional regulator n=1 Tax=Rhodoferax koreensis TaxID=1842727 RepID=A0A1P8JWL3_9BURK|nr:FMN-binding negative transcriptional regulator [Rhodoferax koreense]APW38147.1 transcriptional regulator [Rhodoferax koreense]